jgi:two-component system sensor histidine kinase ChvG
VRLLLVNLLVLLVPFAGIEFARIHERQLLEALERDMRDQAVLVRALVERDAALRDATADGRSLDLDAVRDILVEAAEVTRTRIRVLDRRGEVVVDSHAGGPPEGPEPPAPTVLPSSVYELPGPLARPRDAPRPLWPDVPRRAEVVAALAGRPASYTRVRDEAPSVILFVTEPVAHDGETVGAVYVTRSTQPVLEELYRIRRGLVKLVTLALLATLLVTLALSLSITRPLGKLARATRRLGAGSGTGALELEVPVVGTGEIREVASALSVLWRTLRARMRYITEFSADVAHELKSPLTSIRGAAELLREDPDASPEVRERFLRNIELDAERLDRLVSRLLELSRIDASSEPFVEVDLDAVIARVVERTGSDEQPVRVEGRAGAVHGRALDLERALLNLVENGLRHGPEGSPVWIRCASRGGRLTIAVEDRGPGVPEAVRGRLFERFFTTEAADRGTGLGLAIVRSVARAHGGEARLDATHSPGARFVLELPQASAA